MKRRLKKHVKHTSTGTWTFVPKKHHAAKRRKKASRRRRR